MPLALLRAVRVSGRPSHFWRLPLLLLALLAVPAARAQILTGTVVDGAFGGGLPAANVAVFAPGTATPVSGSATDLDGRYRITGLAAGTYDVAFSFIGYATQRVTGVALAAGQVQTLDVTLDEEEVGGEVEEVVVTADAVRNSGASLLRERQRASAVSDAIAADEIARSGAGNAADALERVTGASVVGGRYVYIRGLGDRYVNTQLNGASLPSSDPNRNAVPLDLFPSDLLDNIVTTKTFTPDQPGSFTGGNVNINTQAFPDRLTFGFSASGAYNAEVSLQDGFLRANTGGRDWLGFDDGTREIPDVWATPGVQPPTITAARSNPDSAAVLDQLARAFNPFLAPSRREAPLNGSFAASVGNQVELFGRPLGFLGSLSYGRDFSGYAAGTTAQYQLTGQVSETDSLTNNLFLSDTRGVEEVLWGGLGTLSFRPDPNHNLGASYLYNRSGISEARYQIGVYPKNFPDENRRFETRTLGWTERSLGSVQARGDHFLPALLGLRAEWTTSLAQTVQDEPDLRFFANDFTFREGADGAPADTFYAVTFSNYGRPARYFRTLDEQTWDNTLRLALPFGGERLAGTVRVGGAVTLSERTFRERRFEYTTNASVYRYDGDPQAFFEEGAGIVDTTATGGFRIGNVIVDATTPSNNYDGDQDVYASFAMAEFRPLARLRAIVGARYEVTRLKAFNADTTGSVNEEDLLPSVNLVYEVEDNMNLRAAYGRTLARPTFRELSPFVSFDFVGDYIFIGNPGLERTLVDNLDLRWEWFTRPGEILAVSGFYKRFQNPIERAIVSNNNQVQFQNVDEATVVGAEFEARRRFERLPLVPGGLEFGANVTLAASRVRIPEFELEVVRALDPDAPDTRDFQGQSPFVGNLDVTYGNEAAGTSLSLLYNVFGRRLANVSLGGTPNVYEFTTGTLDITYRQSVWGGLGFSASAKNVLGQDVEFGHTYKGVDYLTRSYERPRTFSVGLAYRFE